MLILTIICSHLLQFATSAPVPVPSQENEFVFWKAEPQTRGTFSLLSNCLITLTLCVWTAVHLNIAVDQQPNETWTFSRRLRSRKAIRRMKWVLMGLLAPELVVFSAWRQWSSARALTRKMRKLLKKNPEDKSETITVEWTMAHSFYAGMGGFVVDISGSSFSKPTLTKPNLASYIPDSHAQLSLSSQGVLFLVSNGYKLPSISKNDIRDRSKADGLAKTLVCLQAGYMIIQCATRLGSNLPLSLLEINTLGHVFCALVMYSFWLHKPQDVQTSTHLSDENLRPICAYMYMGSPISRAWDGTNREFSKLQSGITSPHTRPFLNENVILLPALEAPTGTVTTIRENETLDGTIFSPLSAQPHRMTRAEKKELNYKNPRRVTRVPETQRPAAIHLDNTGVTRWQLAASFLRAHSLYPDDFRHQMTSAFGPNASSSSVYFLREVPNWPSEAGLISEAFYSIWAAIACVVGLYGGLHIGAWNSHFPSPIERILWCTSSVLVAASGSLALILITIDRLPSRGKESYLKWWLKAIGGDYGVETSGCCLGLEVALAFIVLVPLVVPFVIGILAYVPARVFLVVEAFISLRDLPIQVYQTPNWTQLIPHL